MVRVRIAPSPTGEDFHIGNAYTALINFAFAKKHNGKFIVRIEDTDQVRLVKGSEERILRSLKWLGLNYDEGPDIGGTYKPYRQSERLPIYHKYAQELIQHKHAYYCFCTSEILDQMRKEQKTKGEIPHYDRRCLSIKNSQDRVEKGEKHVIRMKIPEGKTEFDDLIRGKISFQNKQLDDQVLIKSDGFPTYHLAVVVDDHLMEISHVIRGEDWISSTPKHILLYQFLGWELPQFVHLPLLRNPDRSKLSKRKNPVWVHWYKEQGFLPEAVINYLALMGWSHPEGKEFFSIDEFIKVFSLDRIQTVGPIFDLEKLRWLNGVYIRETQNSKLGNQIYEFFDKQYDSSLIEKTLPLVKDRIKTLREYESLAHFFFEAPKGYEKPLDKEVITTLTQVLKDTDWNHDAMEKALRDLADQLNKKPKEVFMQLRIATTGKQVGPPLLESMEILGKVECLKRLNI